MLPDRLAIARCLHNLANAVKVGGDYSRARWALREAADIFEELGDRSGAAWSINQLGDMSREQGDVAGARVLYRRALSAFRETGDRWGVARSLTDLGAIDGEQGDSPAAHAEYCEALQIFAGLSHRRGVARVLEGCACLAVAQGHPTRALKLAAAGAHLRTVIGAFLPPAEQSGLDLKLRPAWTSLGDRNGQDAWASGSAMSLERAIEFCLEEPESAISA
jgi:tetratricopeptide (TPR) repeat protein